MAATDQTAPPLRQLGDGTKLNPYAGGYLETGCGRPQRPAVIRRVALQGAAGRPHVSVHARSGSTCHAPDR